MKSVAFPCTYWCCPGCGQSVWLRDVVLHFDEILHIGPEDEFGCAACGHCLTEKQMRPNRLNGLTHKGWRATCPTCFRGVEVPSEDLPPATKCDCCGETFEVTRPA
jgi:hypothetical protein